LDASTILGGIAVFGILALGAANVWALRGVLSHRIEPTLTAAHSQRTRDLDELGTRIQADLDRLTLAVSEGIARTDRSEKRIQKTVTSARRLVRENGLEHAGIEAEFAELQPPDAEGSEPLPALPEEMAVTRTIRIPGGHLEIGAA